MNTLSTIKLSRAPNVRGNTVTVTMQDGRIVAVTAFSEIVNHPKLGPTVKMLDAVTNEAAADLVAKNEDGYHGKALDAERATFFAKVKPTLDHTIKVAKETRADYGVRRARTLEFNRDAEPGPALRSDLRRYLMSRDPAQRIAVLLASNYDMAVAAVEIGSNVIGVDQKVWDEFLDRARALIYIRNTGTDGSSVRKSTPEFITAAGTDPDAAMASANEAVNRLHEDGEILDLAESYLQSMVAFVSLLSDKPVKEILPQ
ncbi:hypothetical protein [Paracoccus yeei]|uniref:hypothetical protein n=1 Tax=Paracoccus yeei TaxID=147645 RepID=UPI003BF83EE5